MKDVLECEHIIAVFTNEKLCTLLRRKLFIVKEIVDALEILYESIIFSQKADITLTEFYKCWIITKLKIQSRINQPSKTNLNKHLFEAIQKREQKLIDNSLMKCNDARSKIL